QGIVKSPIFVTTNNTKWFLRLDLRHIQWRKSRIGIHLLLDHCPDGRQSVDIEFNAFKVALNEWTNAKELVTIFSKRSLVKPGEPLGEEIVFDDYFQDETNFVVYFEIIHADSQPSISDKVGNRLVDDFKSMISDTGDGFGDVKLVVKGREFTAHKCVLSVRSRVFSAMFATDMKECHENRVNIDDMDVDVFEQLLSFIYTGI
ncbi:unnamed protein product, partial [Oppiella nova]